MLLYEHIWARHIWARTIYLYGVYTVYIRYVVILIYGVHTVCLAGKSPYILSCTVCVYTVLANPNLLLCGSGAAAGKQHCSASDLANHLN